MLKQASNILCVKLDDDQNSSIAQAIYAWDLEKALHSTIIDDLFGGLLQSTLTCFVCGRQSLSFEYFLDISLPLPSERHIKASLNVEVWIPLLDLDLHELV